MEQIGKPTHFNVDNYLDCVEQMICADECERALLLLDNLPAYYRDHVPERALEIRESLHRQLWTPIQYRGIYSNAPYDPSTHAWPLRAQKLEEIVAVNPGCHIMDLAPGDLRLDDGLEYRGHGFTYESVGLDGRSIRTAKPDAFTIFCAFEIIEHLSNECEIYQNYLKFNRTADIVMLSTPLYTYGGGLSDWRKRELGHLRAYTPGEFHAKASAMFKGYEWEGVMDDTIVLTGRRK